jgi:hypothetical protein
MDRAIDKAGIVKSTIKEFLELFRAIFKADVCYLYLVNKEMDNSEKLKHFHERMDIIKDTYKKHGNETCKEPDKELPPYLKPYDEADDANEILESIDILKFIDVVKKNGVKGWDVTVENRPVKYVIFNKIKSEEIRGEGLTAYMARVKHPQQFFNSHTEVKEHASSAFSNHINKISKQCDLMIGFPLKDENGHTIGVLKIENYSKCEDQHNADRKEHIINVSRSKNYSECEYKYTGEYKYNSKDSRFIAVESYIPLLVQLIKSSEESFKLNSYESLFKGMGLLENLKKMEFPVPQDKIKFPVQQDNNELSDTTNKMKLSGPTNKMKLLDPPKNIRHITNGEIYEDTLHLFLVLKRKEFIGNDEILRRITHYVMGIGAKLGLNKEILKYFKNNLDQFQKHEEYLLSGLDKYRDHFIHQFHVFVSGYIIINELGIENFKLSIQKSMNWILSQNNNECDNGEEYRISDADVLRIWFLTAFYHDFAYILEKLDERLGKLFENLLGYPFSVKFDWENLLTDKTAFSMHICDLLRFFMSKNGTNTDQLLQNYLNAIIKSHDHGVLGALLLIHSSKKITYRNINECYYAALAISLHNPIVYKSLREGECRNNKESTAISFESFPIAFLLAFCDTAQTFGRIETKGGEETNDYPVKFLGIDIVENEKVIYKLAYTDKTKIPTAKNIEDWAHGVNQIFKSFEYSFVIEYYKTDEETDEEYLKKEDLKPGVKELISTLYF